MKTKKQLLLTFDYELFLGKKSGSVSQCCIEPTALLLALMKKYDLKGVFFVDTSYLVTLQNYIQNPNTDPKTKQNLQTDFNAIAQQLTQMHTQGHSVFPHIHPHWLDANYDPTTHFWQLNNTQKYRFNALDQTQKNTLFEQSIQILKQILGQNACIDAYRAGGWCIQPFADFKPFFEQSNIKYDMSVLRNLKNMTTAQYYDFTQIPQKNIYHFENDVCTENQNGKFKQLSISTLNINKKIIFLNKIFEKVNSKLGNRSFGNGIGVESKPLEPSTTEVQKIASLEMVSAELLNALKLPIYKHFLDRNEYMHFISHPKMLTKHNLYCLDTFLNYATKKYQIKTNFRQF